MVHRFFFSHDPPFQLSLFSIFLPSIFFGGGGWRLLPVTYFFCVKHGTHAAKKKVTARGGHNSAEFRSFLFFCRLLRLGFSSDFLARPIFFPPGFCCTGRTGRNFDNKREKSAIDMPLIQSDVPLRTRMATASGQKKKMKSSHRRLLVCNEQLEAS